MIVRREERQSALNYKNQIQTSKKSIPSSEFSYLHSAKMKVKGNSNGQIGKEEVAQDRIPRSLGTVMDL